MKLAWAGQVEFVWVNFVGLVGLIDTLSHGVAEGENSFRAHLVGVIWGRMEKNWFFVLFEWERKERFYLYPKIKRENTNVFLKKKKIRETKPTFLIFGIFFPSFFNILFEPI